MTYKVGMLVIGFSGYVALEENDLASIRAYAMTPYVITEVFCEV